MHFTTMENAVSILNSGEFWFSPMSRSNDAYERKFQEGKAEELFTLCFCVTTTGQKLPLWYMYSGISGQGVALRYRPSDLRDFISDIKTIEGIAVDSGSREKLYLDSDFTMEYGRVVYIARDRGNDITAYKENGRIIHHDDQSFDDKKEENAAPFVKLYPWEYENEFRIVLKLKPRHKGRFRNLAVRIPDLDSLELHYAYNVKGEIKDTLKARGLKPEIADSIVIQRCEVGIEGALLKRIDREAIRLLLEDPEENKEVIDMLKDELGRFMR